MNDMLLNMLANDSFTVSDFKAVGLTAENTKLESEDKYLQSQMIQDNLTFKDINGNFSKDKFHQYYLLATDYYNKMADDNYIEDLSKNTFYSKDNLFAPEQSKKFDETPTFVTVPNPFLQNNSLIRVESPFFLKGRCFLCRRSVQAPPSRGSCQPAGLTEGG